MESSWHRPCDLTLDRCQTDSSSKVAATCLFAPDRWCLIAIVLHTSATVANGRDGFGSKSILRIHVGSMPIRVLPGGCCYVFIVPDRWCLIIIALQTNLTMADSRRGVESASILRLRVGSMPIRLIYKGCAACSIVPERWYFFVIRFIFLRQSNVTLPNRRICFGSTLILRPLVGSRPTRFLYEGCCHMYHLCQIDDD